MIYSIEWDSRAFKFLDKLQKDVAQRILNKLNDVRGDPFRYLEHYEGDGYKLRIGDYRMILDVDFENNILIVQVFDKRGRVYKS